jgi:Cytochrome c554 and c-prime
MKALLAVGVLLLSLLGSSPPPAPPAENAVLDGCPRVEDATYVGAESCKKCHFKQHSSWKKTKMAKAFDTLKPGNAAEAKKKFNLDEKKDYTTDAKCVECHTTGYGKPGGYPKIEEGKKFSEEEAKRATAMENVQCESCHGPGSLTNAFKKDNEAYKKEELTKRGMINADEANCKTCHNDKSPTITKDYKFDYAASTKDPEKVHTHVPLTQKH